MRQFRKTVLLVLLSTLLSVLTAVFTTTYAATAQPTSAPTEEGVSDFLAKAQDAVFYPDVTGKDSQKLRASAAEDIERTGTHLLPGDSLDFDSQTVKATPENAYVVSIPVRGPAVPHGASVAVLYSSTFERIGMIENQLHSIDENSGRVQSWVDGKSIYDETVTAENLSGDRPQARGMNWGVLNDCLASLGIPAWIAAGLSNICAVACLLTAGAGCVICIAGVIGFSGGAVTACVQRAWQ